MKATSFLSVCTLALAAAVAANHGQFEHNSVAPAHTGAPANKPAHHWAAREAREREHEHEHSAHTDDSDKKASHHHETREAREPHRVHHSREAGRHEYTLKAPASKPSHHHWEARKAREHEHEHEAAPNGGMEPTATRHHIREAGKPTNRPSHSDSMDEKKEDSKPSRHWLRSMFESKKLEDFKAGHGRHHARDADRKEKHKHAEEGKSHCHARDADHKEKHKHAEDEPESHHHGARDHKEDHTKPKHSEEVKSHHAARDAIRKEEDHKQTEGKPEGHAHHARSADRKEANDHKKPEPMHTGGAVAGKPGHHFVRRAARPTGHPNFSAGGNFANNPFMGTRFTPGSAITSVRGILTGQSGIKHTCDRCVAAMQVGQSLAQQSSTSEFSSAVVGLCQQVRYKSNDGCASAFSVGKVGLYVSALQNADLGSDGKGFCRQYFGAC